MSYRAVLFDLDGTLLDTLADLAAAGNAALRAMGLPEHPVEAYRYFVGDGMERLVRRLLPAECGDAATLAACGARMRAEYAARWADTTRPYAGVAELLDALAARRLPLAVLSNKPDEFTQLCVARLLPQWRFEVILGAQAGWPRKPDPATALEIARRLAVPPADVLYLGDTNTDMQTATAAGMFAVGVLWGFRTANELLAAGARVLLAQPTELLDLLEPPTA